MVLPLCFQGAGSGLKTQAQFVHGAQQPVALALIMIGPVQTPLHHWCVLLDISVVHQALNPLIIL